MRRIVATVLMVALCGATVASSRASVAAVAIGSESTENLRLLARYDFVDGAMSFEGRRLVVDSGAGFWIARLARDRPFVRLKTTYVCPTSHDRTVSLWRGFVIHSGIRERDSTSPGCNDTNPKVTRGGIRIVDARDHEQPREVRFIEPSCSRGSPGHALLPVGDRTYIYDVWEIPYCDPTRPEPLYMKVLKFNPARPRRAHAVSTPGSEATEGCDRMTVHVARRLLACSAINRITLFDISDPPNPRAVGVAALHAGFLWEGSFTWDGDYFVVGQYIQGTDRCDVIILDVRDPAAPVEVGRMDPPRAQATGCHFPFSVSVLPTKDERRYLALVGWTDSGMSLIDFSDPSTPEEIAAYWGSSIHFAYWYNGRIYAISRSKPSGVYVFKLDGAGPHTMNYLKRFYPHTQYADFKS